MPAAVAAGRTDIGIAADLFPSERTVEQHPRSDCDKLGLVGHGDSNRRGRRPVAAPDRPEGGAGSLGGPTFLMLPVRPGSSG